MTPLVSASYLVSRLCGKTRRWRRGLLARNDGPIRGSVWVTPAAVIRRGLVVQLLVITRPVA